MNYATRHTTSSLTMIADRINDANFVFENVNIFYRSFKNKDIINTFCARVTYKYGIKWQKWHDKNPFVINKWING